MTASKYNQELADEIIERLSSGVPLAEICRGDHMPDRRTVGNWRQADEEFNKRFLQARDEGFDAIAERTRQTARGKGDEDGGDSSGDVQRDKLIIDTDLKLLAKWDPRRYGERLQLANDPENPIAGLTDEQIDARIRALQESDHG